MRSAMEVNDAQCSTILYCGVPYLLPVQNLIKNTHWLETAPPSIPYRAHINMTNREKVNATLERFHFKITGILVLLYIFVDLTQYSFKFESIIILSLRTYNNINESFFATLHFYNLGPDHIGIMLSPVVGAQVSSWSLVAGQKPLGNPLWNGNRESYFIYLAASSEHEIPWHFHIDITVRIYLIHFYEQNVY